MQIQNDENELQKAIDDIAKNAAGNSEVSDLDAKVQDQLGVPPVPEMDATIPEVPEMPVGLEVPAGMGEVPMPGGENLAVGTEMPEPEETTEVVSEESEEELPAIEIKETAPIEGVEEPAEVVEETVTEEVAEPEEPVAEAATEEVAEPEKAEEPEKVETVSEAAPVATGDFKDVKAAALKDLYPLLEKIQVNPEQKCKIYREAYEATGDKEIIPKMYEAIKGLEDERMRAEQLLWVVGL